MRPTIHRATTLLAAATLTIGLAACADDDPTVDDAPETEAPDDAGQDDTGQDDTGQDDTGQDDTGDAADDAVEDDADGETVVMTFFNFEPEDLTVPVGTTVTWVNEDAVRHTATADDGSFDVDTPAEGDEGSHTFDEAGEFTYVCEVHASMTATITVE